MVDDGDWTFRALVADTGHRRHGDQVVLQLSWVERIDWLESAVHVSVDREAVRDAPAHAPRK